MKLRLYVMDIQELEEADLRAQALRLLDPTRKEKVIRSKNEKDRARLAGAGLLLLLAHAGLRGSMDMTDETVSRGNLSEAGKAGVENVTKIYEGLQILTPALIIQTIIREEENRGRPLFEGIFYEVSDRGRPSWGTDSLSGEAGRADAEMTGQLPKERERAAYPYFNLSHSGHYAALAASDMPVGIDIQEPREVHHKSIGDYRKFSRMESYFKCTGRGIDSKIDACYRELEEAEQSGGYVFRNMPMPEEYALWVCMKTDSRKRNETADGRFTRGENNKEVTA